MQKGFGLFLLLAVCVACALPAILPHNETPEVFSGENFQITPPQGWHIANSDLLAKSHPAFNGPEVFRADNAQKTQHGFYTAWCSIYQSTPTAPEPLHKRVEAAIEFSQQHSGKEISLADTTLAGEKAIERIYRMPQGEPWYQVDEVWAEHAQQIYVLSCWTYPTQYERDTPVFQALASSWQWK